MNARHWSDLHRQSERLAAEAQTAALTAPGRARDLYMRAAKLETQALGELAPTKLRTIGITAVSAVALWFKAGRFDEAQKLAYSVLANGSLPRFASQQIAQILEVLLPAAGDAEGRDAASLEAG